MLRLRRAWIFAAIGTFAAVLIFFARALQPDVAFLNRDALRVHLPLHLFWIDQLRSGHFPAWFPYDSLGQPFVGMTISGAFHPSNLLYLALPPLEAFRWQTLLAYPVAFLGMLRLGRTLRLGWIACALAAVAFTFCGYFVCISNNLCYLWAGAALPWVWSESLRAARDRALGSGIAAAVALALILLAGDPFSFALACCGVLAVGLTAGESSLRSRLGSAILVVALAAGLSAAQLLPSLQMRQDARTAHASLDVALQESVHPLRPLELALGPLWLNPERSQLLSDAMGQALEPALGGPWVDSQHLGAALLVLAAVGWWTVRRRRAAQVAAAAFVVLTLLWLGRHAHLYAALYHLLPPWRVFRYPEKLSGFLVLLLAVAAGMGLEASASPQRQRSLAWGYVAALGLVGLAWIGEIRLGLFSRHLFAWAWPALSGEDRAALGRNLLLCAGETAGILASLVALNTFVDAFVLRGSVTVFVIFLYLLRAGSSLYWATPTSILQSPPTLLSAMAQHAPSGDLGGLRIFSAAGSPIRERVPPELRAEAFVPLAQLESLRPDVGAIWRVGTLDSYLPAGSERLVRAMPQALEQGPIFGMGFAVLPTARARALASPQTTVITGSANLGLSVLQLPALPRAYLAWPTCVSGEDQAQAGIQSKAFRSGVEALIECAGEHPLPPPAGSPGQAKLSQTEPDRITVQVLANAPAVLVINDAYYSGWTATLDGRPAPIRPANVAVRGIFVPAGQHQVELVYSCPGLRLGVWISALTLLLGLTALILSRTWLRTSPRPTP